LSTSVLISRYASGGNSLTVSFVQRTAVLPDAPTIAEAGVPGYELNSWYGVLVPSRTPTAIVTKLNSVISEAVRAADTRERFSAVVSRRRR
jgi:tripartite-type tricarboxylate transporter receptor subunit TctC